MSLKFLIRQGMFEIIIGRFTYVEDVRRYEWWIGNQDCLFWWMLMPSLCFLWEWIRWVTVVIVSPKGTGTKVIVSVIWEIPLFSSVLLKVLW